MRTGASAPVLVSSACKSLDWKKLKFRFCRLNREIHDSFSSEFCRPILSLNTARKLHDFAQRSLGCLWFEIIEIFTKNAVLSWVTDLYLFFGGGCCEAFSSSLVVGEWFGGWWR